MNEEDLVINAISREEAAAALWHLKQIKIADVPYAHVVPLYKFVRQLDNALTQYEEDHS